MTAERDNEPYRQRLAIHRVGDTLCVPLVGARLPARCLVCNSSLELVRQKTILYRAGRPDSIVWLFAVLCTNWLALLYLKPVIVEFSICRAHLREHRRRLLVTWALLGAVFALAISCFIAGTRVAGTLLMIAFALGAVFARRYNRIVRLKRADDECAWLVTAPEFLDSFPDEK